MNEHQHHFKKLYKIISVNDMGKVNEADIIWIFTDSWSRELYRLKENRYLEKNGLSFAALFANHVIRGKNEVICRKFAVGNALLLADHPDDDIR